jgi:hypothetical protein
MPCGYEGGATELHNRNCVDNSIRRDKMRNLSKELHQSEKFEHKKLFIEYRRIYDFMTFLRLTLLNYYDNMRL